MRILYFADIRFPLERANGIQTMETCHALAARGHRLDLIVRPDSRTPARDPFAYYALPANTLLGVARVPAWGPASVRRAVYLVSALRRAALPSGTDAIFTRDLGVASVLLRVPRSLRPPLVYESHGYAPEVAAALPDLVATAARPDVGKLERLARREAHVWKRADAYVTITAGLQRTLIERFGSRDHVAIVPDGVRNSGLAPRSSGTGSFDPDRPRPEARGQSPEPRSAFTVAYAGHLYPWKGVEVLIDALALVPEARGLIVGGHAEEPDLGRLQARAIAAGVADRVTFTGLVEPAQVSPLLQTADVLALPNPASAISTRFTSPLKLFEYMAAGRPIVASDLPAIREVLRDGVDGLLVEPGNAAALAGAIRRLSADPPLGATLARHALDGVSQYSWDRRAERLETLLREVLTTASTSAADVPGQSVEDDAGGARPVRHGHQRR